ncbi:MAG TPA: hypothetical protein VFQ77_03355 [Pseudonocardiaceae bacterium]|jgi:hypothetical protein|nr:hypothetical protein [Pseudonocardiaceae bacterium]
MKIVLGCDEGVLIADDTQGIKKGVKTVGVAPQHCGVTQTECSTCELRLT